MASLNKKRVVTHRTHEGAPARHITEIQELKRTLMSCMLWENNFYENGVSVADRMKSLVSSIEDKAAIAELAVYARSKGNLRHAPLLITRELVRNGYNAKTLLQDVIQRPDEIAEFMAIYWAEGKTPIANSVKKGLALALKKFDAYQLSKWNKSGKAVTLRDVMFLTHAKPGLGKEDLFKALAENTLESPDTWEVELSAGKDKAEVFTRLMAEKKLGALACLRNLRNMQEAGIDKSIIASYMSGMDTSRVLPFRFIAAARFAPSLEPALESTMFRSLVGRAKLSGSVAVVVDVSGSMSDPLSEKSDMRRLDAACGLAMLVRELADDVDIYSFSNDVVSVPTRRGFALRDAIVTSQCNGGTYLGKALTTITAKRHYDTTIVITDEQSCDAVPNPKGVGYMINVASCKNGVGYGPWIHIDGFSEAILDFIQEHISQR